MFRVEYKGDDIRDYYYITLHDSWVLCEFSDPDFPFKFSTSAEADAHIERCWTERKIHD